MKPTHYLAAWSYVLVCGVLIQRTLSPVTSHGSAVYADPGPGEVAWFRRVKPYCNSVEIGTLLRETPAPNTVAGAGYKAACYALAGRIDDSRRIVDQIPATDRYKAVGIVFDVGHPVADAGDDRAAGPIMELVIDYWPNHYMALYHAGMAEYMLGQRDLSRHNLQEFQKYYHERDGWSANAVEILKRLDDPAAMPAHRPAEPPGS